MGVHFHFFEHFISFKSLLKLSSRQKDGGYYSTDIYLVEDKDCKLAGLRWHHGPQKSSGDCEREGHGAEEL